MRTLSALLLLCLLALPAWAGPVVESLGLADPSLRVSQLTTPHFRIVHTEAATGVARVLEAALEQAHADVEQVLGRPWPGVTEVRVGLGPAEYRGLALPGTHPPTWAVALAWPEAGIVLVEGRSLNRPEGHQTLRHELFHAALGRVGHGWPRWFQEGMAQELTGERKYSLELYTTLARAVRQDRIYRFRDLAEGFPDRTEDVQVAYAQSAAFVQFLKERHGRQALGELLTFVGRGDVFETAFGKAFHSPLSVEEELFREELPSRYPIWPVITTGTTLWVAMSLLVVVGAVRRKRQVTRLRALQLREEQTTDGAQALARRFGRADNDGLLVDPLWRDVPWLIHVCRWESKERRPPAQAAAEGDAAH